MAHDAAAAVAVADAVVGIGPAQGVLPESYCLTVWDNLRLGKRSR